MKFTKFTIKNFRGIKSTTLDLSKTPKNSICSLVGLNESGKTTILEAINNFRSNPDLKKNDPSLKIRTDRDYQAMLPISERALFNGSISIQSSLLMDANDIQIIDQELKEIFGWTEVNYKKEFTIDQKINFENSRFKNIDNLWSLSFEGRKRKGKTSFKKLSGEEWRMAVRTVEKLLPKVIYFPASILDFPDQIILERSPDQKKESDKGTATKNNFYYDVLNDVLKSIDTNLEIDKHIIARAKSKSTIDRQNLEALVQKIEVNLNKTILGAWRDILNTELGEKRFRFYVNTNESNEIRAEIKLADTNGIFSLNERSAGFRWFFSFILLVTYRTHRNDRVLFLFDEPAANLHPRAQTKLLHSFSELSKTHQFIYTTHSHYLIDPARLESTFVIKNENQEDPLDLFDSAPELSNITATPYRSFVGNHADQQFYYKPIMDALDYTPSAINLANASVLIEGKTDFYCLEYFKRIIFKDHNEIILFPGGGSGSLDSLISLLSGWGAEYVILLDGDAAGESEKKRYSDKFEAIVENRILTLAEIKETKEKVLIEHLFSKTDQELIRKTYFPTHDKLSKKIFHKAIQEMLINQTKLQFEEATLKNFKAVLDSLASRILLLKLL